MSKKSRMETTSRRAFVLSGGATLGAGIAASTGAAALAPGRVASANAGTDYAAIHAVHRAWIAGVEAGTLEAVLATHRAYRSNARQVEDQLVVDKDHRTAAATWHVDVKRGIALTGDSTIEQMARQQGLLADVQWEAGRLEARYEKTRGAWRMTELNYFST